MKSQSLITSSMFGGVAVATLLLGAPLAHAQEGTSEDDAAPALAPGLQLSLKLEPGLAVALTDPQSDTTEPGFRQTLKALFGVSRYVAVGPSFAFTTLPAASSMTSSASSWALGATARLERPHDAPGGRFQAMSPWVDADLLYVRSEERNLPGFAAAAGLAVPIDHDRNFWFGPFVRYSQVIEGERAGFDTRDSKILSLGLSLEVGSGLQHKRPMIARVTEPVAAIVPVADSDRDGDTVSDNADNCPDVAGPVENSGCPTYKNVIVKPDKLELKEKIAFEWNSANLEPASLPLLDDVVQALQDNRGFNVQVDGHASSEGTFDHNQTLSEQRAEAVLTYLVSRGVARDRLVFKGFGETVPTETNTTPEGRESNRRVEFVVSFIIIKKAS